MALRSRSSRHLPTMLLTLALLLPLLAACGAAAPTSQNGAASIIPTTVPPVGPGGPAEPQAARSTAAAAMEAPAIAAAAPTAPPPESAGSSSADEGAAPIAAAATAAPAAAGVAMRGTQTPPIAPNQQQRTPLKAGEVDDNADFAAYLDYLSVYGGPPARAVDVGERYVLTVLNGRQQPVLDARVRLFDGQRQVFEGRTYAGGKTIVFPRALGLSENSGKLRVLIDKGNGAAEGTLARGQDGTLSFVLRDAEALPQTPRLDVLFLLDATGSMGDEIGQIQQTIASIAERIDRIEPRPALRFGLVSYRDRGDEYVTRVDDFTADVAGFRRTLLATRADGGGDEPESLNEALHAAVQRVSWSEDAVRLVFLVADAPPHLDYAQDYDYVDETRAAVARGVKVYPIAASNASDQAEYVFRQLAQQTLGRFIFLTYQPGQNSGAPGDTTTHQVDPEAFTVERLDDLVVQVVQRELAMAQGVA